MRGILGVLTGFTGFFMLLIGAAMAIVEFDTILFHGGLAATMLAGLIRFSEGCGFPLPGIAAGLYEGLPVWGGLVFVCIGRHLWRTR